MKTIARRGGFTLIELLMVAVLGAIVVMTAHSLLTTNLRAHAVMSARIGAQATVRGSSDVLFGELREVSPSEGDIVAMSADSISVRSMRGFGIVCAVTVAATPTITVMQVGEWFGAGDSIVVLADNETGTDSDDVWLAGSIGTVDTTQSCPSGAAAQRLTLPGMSAAMTADSVRTGGPVRAFEHLWYGLSYFYDGWYLSRRSPGAGVSPMVGPLVSGSSGGLSFAYQDQFGATTTNPINVAQIRVTLRAQSDVVDPAGSPVGDSTLTIIHPRN